MKYLAAISALALALSALGTPALAQPVPRPVPAQQPDVKQVKAEVIVLHATNEGKGIDPNIGDLPQLKKPPFSAYDTYKLLDRPTLTLARGQVASHKLPNDGKLNVELKDILVEKDSEKLVVGASIDQPDGKRFVEMTVTSARGGIFFVAGPAYKGGILVLAIRVGVP
ncbi:MAG: hypothetical protein IT373_12350 [Polyangiaceae bacterium]|nr:hypothetical protein [Polyangiaceae bacterium]